MKEAGTEEPPSVIKRSTAIPKAGGVSGPDGGHSRPTEERELLGVLAHVAPPGRNQPGLQPQDSDHRS